MFILFTTISTYTDKLPSFMFFKQCIFILSYLIKTAHVDD